MFLISPCVDTIPAPKKTLVNGDQVHCLYLICSCFGAVCLWNRLPQETLLNRKMGRDVPKDSGKSPDGVWARHSIPQCLVILELYQESFAETKVRWVYQHAMRKKPQTCGIQKVLGSIFVTWRCIRFWCEIVRPKQSRNFRYLNRYVVVTGFMWSVGGLTLLKLESKTLRLGSCTYHPKSLTLWRPRQR